MSEAVQPPISPFEYFLIPVFKGEDGNVYYQNGKRFFKLVLQIPPPPMARVEAPSSDEDEEEEEEPK